MGLFPTLANIGTSRLFADGDKTFIFDDFSRGGIAFGCRGFDPNPFRFAQDLSLRIIRLLRMAQLLRGSYILIGIN